MAESEAKRDVQRAWGLAQRARRAFDIARLIADEVTGSEQEVTRQLVSAWEAWGELRASGTDGEEGASLDQIDASFLPADERPGFQKAIAKLVGAATEEGEIGRKEVEKHLEWLARALPAEEARARRAAGVAHPAKQSAVLVAVVLGFFVLLIGSASLWQSAASTPPPWRATFYAKPDFKGKTATQMHDSVDFKWGEGKPTFEIPAERFSARVESCLRIAEGETLEFSLLSDDGSRLFINGHLVVDNWGVHPEIEVTERMFLEEGTHHLVVEFFENAKSARLRLGIFGDDGRALSSSRFSPPRGEPGAPGGCDG